MSSPPYAKPLAAINGGAPQSGGIIVQKGDTIQLTGENTAYWTSARWEIYAYPEGWSAPAGWSTAADGTYYSTAFVPPVFTAPGITLWGKIGVRLTVNGGILNGLLNPQMRSTITSFSVLSAAGLREVHSLEENQFGADWTADQRRTLKAIEAAIGVSPTTCLTSPAGPPVVLQTYPLPTNSRLYPVRSRVVCYGSNGTDHGAWDLDYLFTRDSVGAATQVYASKTLLVRSDATLDVTVALGGTTVTITATGMAAVGMRWLMLRESYLALPYF